jgi:Zn-finger nucleic acid-binding protein
MHAQNNEAVQIDVCCQCGGTWFDRGELSKVLGTDAERENIPQHTTSSTKYPCPRCSVGLCTESYRGAPTLRIDFCVRCQGIFLDADELPKVKEVASQPPRPIEPELAKSPADIDRSKGFLTKLLNLFRHENP